MYTGFAEIYDRLMSDVDYEAWAEFYAKLLSHYGIRKGKVCECACGTGSLTVGLQDLGFQMTGVDLSQEMLFIASQKAREMGMGIPFVRQDMRALKLHRPMDAVLATCDGVNYLLTDEDALAFFKAAYAALRPGGVIVFDISTMYKLKNALGNRLICEDEEDVTYVWQNTYHPKTDTVEMHLCFFLKEKDGRYRRIDEEQTQRAHTVANLFSLLREAGFTSMSVFGATSMDKPRENEQRVHIAAIKPATAE